MFDIWALQHKNDSLIFDIYIYIYIYIYIQMYIYIYVISAFSVTLTNSPRYKKLNLVCNKFVKNSFIKGTIMQSNKYMITSIQVTNTEIFTFISVLVFKLLSCKVLFINRKCKRSCQKVGYFFKRKANFTGKLLQNYE